MIQHKILLGCFVAFHVRDILTRHRHRENGEFKCSLYQRRKTGNLPKKSVFAQGIYLQHRKKLKIKGCTRVVVGYMWWDIIFWGKKNKEMLKTEGTLPKWSVKA